MEKQGFVYILANAARHIYIGSTTNLIGRLHQHRLKPLPGFTRDHNMTLLVWYGRARQFATWSPGSGS
jgi:putative endonuclease